MKIYLDSLDSYYSISHEPKENQKSTLPKKENHNEIGNNNGNNSDSKGCCFNDVTNLFNGVTSSITLLSRLSNIGHLYKILGLGITSVVITLMLSNTIANGFMSMDGTGTYYSTQDLQTAYDYCISHASDIVAGKNPVLDLVASKLISPDFTGMTCDQVKTEKGLKQSHDGLMNELANLD